MFGGTGYTGGSVVREAASRGHHVISVSRSEPKEPVQGVRYEVGNVHDVAQRATQGADAVVAALSPRGDMARTCSYRLGGEVALFDAVGNSNTSGADLAIAIVDEIDNPRHHREHISIAY
ncbi:MAG TPA: NAD(P)H-binding protein [Ornithinibacter sp.]|nr:NAD(P)H-binding protein [Ornithinibacter sp.]